MVPGGHQMAVGRPERRRALARSAVVIGEIMEGKKKQSAGDVGSGIL